MALIWKGVQVLRKIKRAERSAVNTTMAAAILHARDNHGPGAHGMDRFQTRTGSLERSVRIVEPASSTIRGTQGSWGSTDTVYARRIELGFQGKDSAGRVVDASAYPFLIPAAQAEYPKLAARIRRAMLRQFSGRIGRLF